MFGFLQCIQQLCIIAATKEQWDKKVTLPHKNVEKNATFFLDCMNYGLKEGERKGFWRELAQLIESMISIVLKLIKKSLTWSDIPHYAFFFYIFYLFKVK